MKSVFVNWRILVLALVVSFIYGLPHLLWLRDLHWDYQNAIFITSLAQAYDNDHYLAQIKEVYEGNYLLSNTYLAEYKNVMRPVWPVFPIYLSALLGKLFYLKVQYLAVLMDFIFPPGIFCLAYCLLYTISRRRSPAMLGAFILICFPHLTKLDTLSTVLSRFFTNWGIQRLWESFWWNDPAIAEAHCYDCYSRIINPQLTYLFLLASLLFFFKGITTAKNKYFVLSTVFGIITSYSYVFFSSYLYAFLGIFAILAHVLNDRGYSSKALIVLSLILLCSLPFWYSVLNFSDKALNQVSAVVHDHNAIINPQVLFTLALCIIIVSHLQRGYLGKLPGIASLTMLLSAVVCLNQQIITGLHVQAFHYDHFVNPQAMILAVTLLATEFMGKRGQHHRSRQGIKPLAVVSLLLYGGIFLVSVSVCLHPSIVASYFSPDGKLTSGLSTLLQTFYIIGVLIGVSFMALGLFLKKRAWRRFIRIGTILYVIVLLWVSWNAVIVKFAWYQGYIKPVYGDLQALAPAVAWLNKHTEPESVILGMVGLRGQNQHISTDAVIAAYTSNNVYISGHARYYAVPPMSELMDRWYNLMYVMGITSQEDFNLFINEMYGEFYGMVPLKSSFEEYQKKLRNDVYSELTRYRLDYLIFGPRERKAFKIDPGKTYSFLRKMYDDRVVQIYQIRPRGGLRNEEK